MIRCVRLWTGNDGGSHVEIGRLDLSPGRNADLVSDTMAAAHVTVEETAGDGEEFTLHHGDVLLAEDTEGTGHQWQLRGDEPWRRMYVVLAPATEVPFVSD